MGKNKKHQESRNQATPKKTETPSVPAGSSAPRWLAPLALAVVLIALLAARLPFLSNPLVGEETYFAYLAVDNGRDPLPPDHKFLYQARLEGKMHFNAAEHPVPPYLFITHVLRPLFGGGADFASLTFEQKSRAGRLPFFAAFCAALVLLLVIAGRVLRGAPAGTVLLCAGVIAFGLSTPLATGGSIQPQVDGSIGVLWVALAAVALELSSGRSPLAAGTLGAFAGFAACLGKNEWAMAMAGAAVLGLALHGLTRLLDHSQPATHNSQPSSFPLVLGLLLGLAAGSLFSYVLDPYNYTHGLDVMQRTQKATAARWGETFHSRLPWIWPVLALGAAAVAAGAMRWRRLFGRDLGLGVLLLWSLALLAGFLASSWPGDFFPRYFCTSCFGFIGFLAAWLPRLRPKTAPAAAILVIILILIGLNGQQLIRINQARTALGSSPGKSLAAHRQMIETQARISASTREAQITDLNFGFYHPELDFIANVVRPEQLAEYQKK